MTSVITYENKITDELKCVKIKKRIFELLLKTSAHGLPRLLNSKKLLTTLMWTIVISLSLSAGSYYVVANILEFLNYNTVNTIDIIKSSQLQFPTVSFCFYPLFNLSISDVIIRLRFDTIDEANFSNLFEEFYDPVYGKCFRYNSGKNLYNETIDILNSTTSGSSNGLKIEFNFNSNDLVEMIVFIHNHSLPPYGMESGGYWMRPGYWSYYEVSTIFYSNLDEPFSKCLKDVQKFIYNKTIINYILKSKRIYNQNDCFYLCSHLYAIEESNCKCNATLNNFDKDCVKQFFDIKANDTKNCVSNYLSQFRVKLESEKCEQYCPLECDSTEYIINNYIEPFPSVGNISERTKNQYSYFNNFSTYEELNMNIASVRVYFKNLKYTSVKTEPKTQTFTLISNIGGLFGVFLGISFLSFVEIFEILFEILIIFFSN
jgi:amiloride-sensitive sodium channel subunit alpha